MELKKNVLSIAILFVSITSATFVGYNTLIGGPLMQQAIKDSNREIDNTIKITSEKILNEINESNQNQLALLERDFKNFKPELKYRIQGVGFEQAKPNSIWYHITNMGDDNTFVKNKWTITGDICNKDGQSQGTSYIFSNYTYMNLTKEDGEKEGNVQIPDEFFTTFIPDKKSFLLKLELEMNPYTDMGGPFEKKEFPRQTFIQYDLNKERLGWMPWTNPSGYLNCTVVPSIWGQTYLNTSSIHDFYVYKNYEFPEEQLFDKN